MSTFGFDTAVGVARKRSTGCTTPAEKSHRVMVLELAVAAIAAGFIACRAGVAGDADAILDFTEIPCGHRKSFAPKVARKARPGWPPLQHCAVSEGGGSSAVGRAGPGLSARPADTLFRKAPPGRHWPAVGAAIEHLMARKHGLKVGLRPHLAAARFGPGPSTAGWAHAFRGRRAARLAGKGKMGPEWSAAGERGHCGLCLWRIAHCLPKASGPGWGKPSACAGELALYSGT